MTARHTFTVRASMLNGDLTNHYRETRQQEGTTSYGIIIGPLVDQRFIDETRNLHASQLAYTAFSSIERAYSQTPEQSPPRGSFSYDAVRLNSLAYVAHLNARRYDATPEHPEGQTFRILEHALPDTSYYADRATGPTLDTVRPLVGLSGDQTIRSELTTHHTRYRTRHRPGLIQVDRRELSKAASKCIEYMELHRLI